MANELAVPQTQSTAAIAVSRHTGRALLTQESLIEEGQQRQLLMAYVKSHMVEGINADYGVIPGTEKKDANGNIIGGKPTLLKPGAEKLVDLFRCYPEYTIEPSSVVDYDRPLFAYTITCKIYSRDTGGTVCVGMGSCSSHESKYRWRTADRTCPACGKAAIKRSKNPPRDNPNGQPGWYCFARINGCGANFNAGDPSIESQVAGRVENLDVADFANTILKIAKKRALVDAAIGLARCSDMFTQDVEDFSQSGNDQPQQQANLKPPTNDQLKAELVRTGWGWPQAIVEMNRVDRTSHSSTAMPANIPPVQLAGFFAWLKSEPTVEAPTNTTPTGADNRTEPTINGQQSQNLLRLCHELDRSWPQLRAELSAQFGPWATDATPGHLTIPQYENVAAHLTQQLNERKAAA